MAADRSPDLTTIVQLAGICLAGVCLFDGARVRGSWLLIWVIFYHRYRHDRAATPRVERKLDRLGPPCKKPINSLAAESNHEEDDVHARLWFVSGSIHQGRPVGVGHVKGS